jgi:hydrogenase maturation protein HypF
VDAPGAVAARITVSGAVQGAGFRPFAYRLARELGLVGSIRNTAYGVLIHVEGDACDVDAFARRLAREAPPAAVLRSVKVGAARPIGASAFEIRGSETGGVLSVAMLPDLATCAACRRELFDRGDRRFGYPFLNCTECGPRLSIIEGLPYDRPRTVMRDFPLCPDCEREYHDPGDRRFHAQPVACSSCGPRLWFEGEPLGQCASPLTAAAQLVRGGGILGLKGLGGYQLVADARQADVVARLRERKGRSEKPFAVMFPDIESVRCAARVAAAEAAALTSAAAPILLLERRPDDASVCDAVAPGLRTVGAMLPYSPLHHLLMSRLGIPVVMTSGNLSEEPMATDENDARPRLGAVADGFLHHDRPIARAVDDSVVRLVGGAPLVLRRARGFAPLPVPLRMALPAIRALGGHLKNTVAWSHGHGILVSQHIGDLDHPLSLTALERTVTDYERLYGLEPVAVACDLHPDYATTRLAEASGLPVITVQHHHAHVASAMAEHDLTGEVLGVSWDGTGYGTDGTVWGGEFLCSSRTGYQRVGRLRPFWLPGGEAAARQPWRSALGVLDAVYGARMWAMDVPPVGRSAPHASTLAALLRPGPCSVKTSSAGRLFDAVAALIGLRQDCSYEAQAATLLEQVADRRADDAYPFALVERQAGKSDPLVEVDWRPAVAALVEDLRRGSSRAVVAGRFHTTLAVMVHAVAEFVALPRVVLSGGCFQNAQLSGLTAQRLREKGFHVFTHSRIPPNDGGLAVGQALVAAHRLLEQGG